MKKTLTKITNKLYHFVDGVKVEGENNNMYGDCSGLTGNCSGLYGDCSGLRGDIDDCELTDEERKNGVDIGDLIN